MNEVHIQAGFGLMVGRSKTRHAQGDDEKEMLEGTMSNLEQEGMREFE